MKLNDGKDEGAGTVAFNIGCYSFLIVLTICITILILSGKV